MRRGDCAFHGRHRPRLEVFEVCRDCGHRRAMGPTSRLALWLVPAALWANGLLMLALVLG